MAVGSGFVDLRREGSEVVEEYGAAQVVATVGPGEEFTSVLTTGPWTAAG